MAAGTCFVCTRNACLYVYREAAGSWVDTTITRASVVTFAKGGASPFSTNWERLPHTVKVDLTPDLQESDQRRTSDTGGVKVKVCADTVSYDLDITSSLCHTDWLWNYLLEDPTDPSSGSVARWFAIIPDCSADLTGDSPVESGAVYIAGKVSPGGLNYDIDSDAEQQTEWKVSGSTAPVFPGVEGSPANGSRGIL